MKTIDQRLEAIERNLCEVNELLRQKPGDNPVLERQQIETDPKSIDIPALKPLIRDWEVLEFRDKDCKWILYNGFYYAGLPYAWPFYLTKIKKDSINLATDGHYTIHSVRRVSDGTKWSIGDVVANPPRGSARISKFSINKNGVMLVEADCFTTPWSLLNIVAARSIYTSADGVAIFEGDTVYEYSNGVIMKTHFAVGKTYSGPLYSTREAAMKAHQPPIYTSADGVGIYEGDTVYFWFVTSHKIVEDKAHKGDMPDNHYSSRAAAETAYKNWLQSQRVLSLEDVLNKDAGELEELVKSRLV